MQGRDAVWLNFLGLQLDHESSCSDGKLKEKRSGWIMHA
jgi:hypothetical protein